MNQKLKVQFTTSKPTNHHGTVQLRCFQPAEYLSDLGWSVEVDNIRKSQPVRSGIVFLHRTPFNRFAIAYANYAKSLGNILIYDTDDLTLRDLSGQEGIWTMCDAVTVSTEHLKERFSCLHDNVVVMKNALSMEYLSIAEDVCKARVEKREREADRPITIGYLSGSSTHDRDFLIVQDTLLRLLKKYPTVRVLLAGKLRFSEDFFAFGDRFDYRAFMPYKDYVRIYKKIDINLAPLDLKSDFCHGKSELKYIEAGACGVPTVASPTATYRRAIQDGISGFLAEDSDWMCKVESLITDGQLRYEVGDFAQQKVLEDYHPSRRGKELESLLRFSISQHRKTENMARSVFYLGLSTLWKHF